jgi:hypothetical protein
MKLPIRMLSLLLALAFATTASASDRPEKIRSLMEAQELAAAA